jgi:hypothetical protein
VPAAAANVGRVSIAYGFTAQNGDSDPQDNVGSARASVPGLTGEMVGVSYYDENGDNRKDPGEGQKGVKITVVGLYDIDRRATTRTDRNGGFRFTGLPSEVPTSGPTSTAISSSRSSPSPEKRSSPSDRGRRPAGVQAVSSGHRGRSPLRHEVYLFAYLVLTFRALQRKLSRFEVRRVVKIRSAGAWQVAARRRPTARETGSAGQAREVPVSPFRASAREGEVCAIRVFGRWSDSDLGWGGHAVMHDVHVAGGNCRRSWDCAVGGAATRSTPKAQERARPSSADTPGACARRKASSG